MVPPQIRNILLPIDESLGTQLAVDYAALLAKAIGASLTLVHVDETPSLMVGIVPGASVASDLALEQRGSRARLAAFAQALFADGLAVATLHLTGPSVVAALVDVVHRKPYDLIVMGTHGRTGVTRLVLGSITEEVLRHAHCPVLTVHMPPEL